MANYSIKELEYWNERIEKIAKGEGLDYYEQEFEILSYEDMIGCETYIGMPSHYPHWSFGKTYEKIKTLHNYNLTGLPYEMVINSDPCIAYLMKDNTLLLQILTMAHVYGHNDFFKNNRLFSKGTRAKYTVEVFKNHADRIREYVKNPGIGYDMVEKILNAAHALKFQIERVVGIKKESEENKRDKIINKIGNIKSEYPLLDQRIKSEPDFLEINKIPIEPEEDILLFIIKYGRLSSWQKDILDIVRQETLYFIPQIETKIMNEGWASFWHYRILNKLELTQDLHFEFLKKHNQVIRPHVGQINPYYIGFKIFEDLLKKSNGDTNKIFEVRQVERDQSFLRRYLTHDLCSELNLFEYQKMGQDYIIKEVSDEAGFKKIRNDLANKVGIGGMPVIRIKELVQKDNSLILEHQFDGRELDLSFTYETMRHIVDLWNGKIVLSTIIDNKNRVITCDEKKKITMVSG